MSLAKDAAYAAAVPRLWTDTIDAHRRDVGNAILDAAAALVGEQGLRSVTMSQIAERTGIGRATLYKYFSDVDAILVAWHERQIAGHLAHLAALGDRFDDPGDRLEAVLEAYALIHHDLAGGVRQGRHLDHGTEVAALLHQGEHVARAEQRLYAFVRELLTECAHAGAVRDDVPPDELALYCLRTLPAAGSLPSKAAVRRLVSVTLGGLRPSS